MREPWDLLGRMRQHRPLWSRYWRTVLVQAGLALVAGMVVFWVGKQGAEAWNDAFGPEELPASTAPVVAGGGSSSGGNAPGSPAVQPTAPGASSAAPAPTGPSQGEDDDADEDDSSRDADAVESDLEEKIKALQSAPPEERNRRTAELVAAAVEKAKKEAGRAQRRAGRSKDKGDNAAEDLADDREAMADQLEELTIAAEALAHDTSKGAGQVRGARRHLERQLDAVQKEARALERRGAAPLSDAERAQLARARAALQVVRRYERGLAGRLGAVLALLAAIYASLGIAQTGILAFSRDFHDVLSRELSLLVQVAPEDPPMRARVRLDVPWVRRKTKRRARFFIAFLPGTVLITLVGRLIPPHRPLTTVLTTLWAAYWWMVLTAAQSARAWTPPETTQRPWYLRWWFALTERVFLFRWALPRWWGRIWERLARNFYGPSERVEEQPFEFGGLALSRALLLIPVVKLLLRPLFPVCAAHLLVEHAGTARLAVPVTAAEVADAASHAPDPDARAHSGVAY